MPLVRAGNLALYVRTAARLKPEQLVHSIYRSIVPQSRPRRPVDTVRIRVRDPLRTPLLSNRAFASAVNAPIDWSGAGLPRLWRYHLHYFDFLNDPAWSDASKNVAIADWIERVPVTSADSTDPYPTSLRIVNWIKYFDGCHGVERRALTRLYQQTLWLERNLERRVLANHLLKNAKALVFAGAFFNGRDAERWRRVGLRLLRDQIREQFLGDGGHFERSPMYHAISLEDVLDTIALLDSAPGFASDGFVRELRTIATAATAYLDAIVLPDGDIPLFNDAAFGVGPCPGELLAYASEVLGVSRLPTDAGVRATSFGATGYYVVRRDDDMLVIDCGDPGPAYQPGHAHADCLSYELALGGRRVVVDTGVNAYEAGEPRTLARSTAAHNTITVDGRDQSEMWGAFRVARRARPLAPRLETLESSTRFRGGHDGFTRSSEKIVHERTVDFDGRRWRFADTVSGNRTHRVASRIHLAPGLLATLSGRTIAVRAGDAEQTIATIVVSPGSAIEIVPSVYYPRFGATETRSVIVISRHAKLPVDFEYTIEATV